MQKTLVIGATGYLGSAIVRVLLARGAEVHGMARSPKSKSKLEAMGVIPVEGNLEDLAALKALVARFTAVIISAHIPFDAEFEIVSAIIEGCRLGNGHFIFTSGTGVLGVESKDGTWSDYAFAEDDPFPFPAGYARMARLKTEDAVRDAASTGLHTTVIRPPLIYGLGGSMQIPMIFESARQTGKACYIGHGLNLYSNAHVDDVAEVFALALEKGTPGALYHVVSGEANFRSIAEAVAAVLGCETQSIDFAQACEIWGELPAGAGLAVNSRSTPRRTRAELGWEPKHIDVIEDIRSGSYKTRYQGMLAAARP